MFSPRITLLLLLLLFIPFVIRFKYPFLEPYPAVLLPVGASTIRQSAGKVVIKHAILYGKNKQDNWQPVNAQLFIDPIPLQYLPDVMDSNFGLEPATIPDNNTVLQLLKKGHLLHQPMKNHVDTLLVKRWLRQRLAAQDFGTALKTAMVADTISLHTKTTIETIIRESSIPLDQ